MGIGRSGLAAVVVLGVAVVGVVFVRSLADNDADMIVSMSKVCFFLEIAVMVFIFLVR